MVEAVALKTLHYGTVRNVSYSIYNYSPEAKGKVEEFRLRIRFIHEQYSARSRVGCGDRLQDRSVA